MSAISRHGAAGYGIRRAASFAGKTAGGAGGGGGRPSLTHLLTRHGAAGHGLRRAGDFSGKTAGGGILGTGGPRPAFGVLSRHGAFGHGARRCGSFAGKTAGVPGTGGGGGGAGGRPDLAAFTRMTPTGLAGRLGWESGAPDLPGTLNATDLRNIAAAVWQYIIEAGLSAETIQRILLAYAAGAVTGGPDRPQIMSVDGSKVRIGGAADEFGNRTRTTLDGS